jgi:hypothetical protein
MYGKRRRGPVPKKTIETIRGYCGIAATAFSCAWRDRRGSVAPLAGLAAIPLIIGVGAAVDYSRASALRAAMQGAVDSTTLKLAEQSAPNVDQAQQVFDAIFDKPQVKNVSVAGTTNNNSNKTTVSVAASGTVKTVFMSFTGVPTLTLNVAASAIRLRKNDGCVLALNSSAAGAVSNGGSTNTSLNNCSVYSNSKSADAVDVGGSATLSALSIGAVGNVSMSGNVSTSDGIETGLAPIADPYSDIAVPSFSGCTQTSLNVNKDMTIDPGVYCKGISVNAGATLTLNPGIYDIDQGSLSVNGGATIIGHGVTLVFTSSTGANWATATINGGASVDLTAPIGGATAGLVIFGDRRIPTGTAFKFNGNSGQRLGGAVYVPTGAISYSGGSGTSTSCTQIIGDTVNFTGDSGVAINCSSYHTRAFGSAIVRLAS